MNDITTAVLAVPSTLLVMSAVAGATAQITQADNAAVKRSVATTGVILLVAAAVTGKPGVVLATGVAVGAVLYATRPIWFGV